MGNVISRKYNNIFSTDDQEKQLYTDVIKKELREIIDSYVGFLRNISRVIARKHTDDVEREKRKFNAVRKELINFLFQHKEFFTLKGIQIFTDTGSALHTLTLDNSGNFEHFLKLCDVSELEWKINCFQGTICVVVNIKYVIALVKEKIIKRIKTVLKKSVISDEDIQ